MVTLYGIKNCDTVKKARRWLEQAGIDYQFHDFRSDGLDAHQVQRWVDFLGWENLLNKRSTTWRKLPETTRSNIDHESAIEVMLQNPAIIKRPILAENKHLHLGFSDQQYSEIFD